MSTLAFNHSVVDLLDLDLDSLDLDLDSDLDLDLLDVGLGLVGLGLGLGRGLGLVGLGLGRWTWTACPKEVCGDARSLWSCCGTQDPWTKWKAVVRRASGSASQPVNDFSWSSCLGPHPPCRVPSRRCSELLVWSPDYTFVDWDLDSTSATWLSWGWSLRSPPQLLGWRYDLKCPPQCLGCCPPQLLGWRYDLKCPPQCLGCRTSSLVFTSIMPWYLFLQDISLAVSCRLVLQIFIFGDLLEAAAIFQDISLAVSCRLVLQVFIFGDLLDAAGLSLSSLRWSSSSSLGPDNWPLMSFSLKSGLWSLTDLFSKSLSLETCLIQLLMKSLILCQSSWPC